MSKNSKKKKKKSGDTHTHRKKKDQQSKHFDYLVDKTVKERKGEKKKRSKEVKKITVQCKTIVLH